MVTQYLEQLIHKGEATYKTAVLGSGPVSVINLPQNRYAVITDFTYFYWNPNQYGAFTEGVIDLETIRAQSVHQVTFRSKLSTNRYMIKNPETIDMFDPVMGPEFSTVQINGYAQFDTYMVHEEDIFVEIVHQPGDGNSITVIAPIERATNNATPPLGYGVSGNGFSVLQAFAHGDNPEFGIEIPLTSENTPLGIANQGLFAFNNKQYIVNDETVFDSIAITGDGTTERIIPIMNIGYVEIRRKADTKVQSTS